MRRYLEESKEIWGEEEIEKLSEKELNLLLKNFNLFASFEPGHIDPLTAELSDTGILEDGEFWTFYEGEPGYDRGIWLTGRFRVWRKI